MIVKDGPFGVEESDIGECNIPSVRLIEEDHLGFKYLIDRHSICRQGLIPKMRGGCFALIEMIDETWHYMGEDDGHYWTSMVICPEDIPPLLSAFKFFDKNIKVAVDFLKGTSKTTYPNGIKAASRIIKKGIFQVMMDRESKLVGVFGKKSKDVFSAYHISERVKVLEAAVKYLGSNNVGS